MKYYFTSAEYDKLWLRVEGEYEPIYERRLAHWNKNYTNYKLTYSEDAYKTDPGYYGYITGEEKHINWFLLQL
jgi:hypothetical protein